MRQRGCRLFALTLSLPKHPRAPFSVRLDYRAGHVRFTRPHCHGHPPVIDHRDVSLTWRAGNGLSDDGDVPGVLIERSDRVSGQPEILSVGDQQIAKSLGVNLVTIARKDEGRRRGTRVDGEPPTLILHLFLETEHADEVRAHHVDPMLVRRRHAPFNEAARILVAVRATNEPVSGRTDPAIEVTTAERARWSNRRASQSITVGVQSTAAPSSYRLYDNHNDTRPPGTRHEAHPSGARGRPPTLPRSPHPAPPRWRQSAPPHPPLALTRWNEATGHPIGMMRNHGNG